MMDRTIKIKDYVTHEKQRVVGDSNGNFTISPLGYPRTNKSGYGKEGGNIPTLFQPMITATPAPDSDVYACVYRHLQNLVIENIDSDDNLFAVDGNIGKLSNLSYTITISNAKYINPEKIYQVSIVSPEMKALDGKYDLIIQDGEYVITPKGTEIVSLDDGVLVPVKVSYIPSDNDYISLNAQENPDENGIYKLYVDEAETGHRIKWIRRGGNPTDGFFEEITMDGTENDNVSGAYDDPSLDHYRKAMSDSEVASYLTEVMGQANIAGKFFGNQFSPAKHGKLVEWFLSKTPVNISSTSLPVYVDGFGKVPETNGGECVLSDIDKQSIRDFEKIKQKCTNWILDTTGNDEKHWAHDWPYNAYNSYHNNITLNYNENPQVGGRHNIVMRTDLKPRDGIIGPRKTFIHLSTPLNLKDGAEYEFNISMPVVDVDKEIAALDDKKLSGYTSYVSQPRAYILSGKQYRLRPNQMKANTLERGDNTFSFFTKRAMPSESIGQIAFSLYNSCSCQTKFPCIGVVSYVSTTVNFYDNKLDKILFTKGGLSKGDGLLIMYQEYGAEDIDVNVINVQSHSDGIHDIITLSKNLHNDMGSVFVLQSKVTCEGTFPYNTKTREWQQQCKEYVCMVDIRYIVDELEAYEGLTERGNMSLFGANPEIDDINPRISKYNQNFRRESNSTGGFKATDPSIIIASVYPTATNTFAWRLNGRNKIKHLGLSSSAAVDYYAANPLAKPLTKYVYDNNKKIMSYMSSTYKLGNLSVDLLPIDYTANDSECSVIGSLLRVELPKDLVNVDSYSDASYVVKQAKKAYIDLCRDFKISRIGYKSDNPSTKTNWFTATSHTKGIVDDIMDLKGDVITPYTESGFVAEQKMNEWIVKLMHLPNSTLGVYPNSSTRNYYYAGFNPSTYDVSFKLFYSADIAGYLEGDNVLYADSKTQTATTQKFSETFSEKSLLGKIPSNPYDYTVNNSILTAFQKHHNGNITNMDQHCSAVNGYMDMRVFTRGLRNISWLVTEYNEIAYSAQCNEMFYPIARVFSPDGIAFPEFLNDTSMTQLLDDDTSRAQLMAYPLEMMLLSEIANPSADSLDENDYALISMYWEENVDEGQDRKVGNAVTNYVKSLVTMDNQKMPHHLYNSHRVDIQHSANSTYTYVVDKYSYRHEISLYQEMLKRVNPNETVVTNYMRMHLNDDFTDTEVIPAEGTPYLITNKGLIFGTSNGDNLTYAKNGSSTSSEANVSSEAVTDDSVKLVDPNMTYTLIDEECSWNSLFMPASLSSGLETASAAYMRNRFGQSYTRIHVSVIFSAALGRWVVKDYYQLPTNYLTPLYGAKTLGWMERSYTNASSSGTFKMEECDSDYLWINQCSNMTDYKSSMNSLYSEQPTLEMNPGCIPFLYKTFPYDKDGKLKQIDGNRFRDLYESIKIPMNADGTENGQQTPQVNFWSLKWNVRQARSVVPGSDIPSLSSRKDTKRNISEPTLGCFTDVFDTSKIPDYMTPSDMSYPIVKENGANILCEDGDYIKREISEDDV